MTDITDIYEEYLLAISRYPVIVALSDADKLIIFKKGLRNLFTATGRIRDYTHSSITATNLDECPYDLLEDEKLYVLLSAQIEFYKQMAADVANPQRITQHRTDALSVTFSNNPLNEINANIANLKSELIELYHRMPRFVAYEAAEEESE